ncbi:MAG: hypothetical protein ACK4S3_08675 [Parvibaculum sp.]
MARTPKTDPNIYQVDLVAGLFGAFMLVWISGAQETEYPGDQIEPPTFATLEMTAKIDDGGAISTYSLVPAQAVDAACLKREYLTSLELAELSDVDCPDRLERRPFDLLAAPFLAYHDGPECHSSMDAPRKPWRYSYSLVTGALDKSGLGLRGVFQRVRPAGGIMPFFETSPVDPAVSMAEFSATNNAAAALRGEAVLICDLQAVHRQAVSLFVVNEDLLDIWNMSSVAISSNFGLIDQLMVMGEGAANPTLWNVPAVVPGDPTKKRVTPANWDRATLSATLCAFREGSRRCFEVNGAPIDSMTLTLASVPNA